MQDTTNHFKLRLLVLSVLLLSFLLLMVLTYTKDCKTNQDCFNAKALTCSRAKAMILNQNNQFLYEIQGKKTEEAEQRCIIKITLVHLEQTATPNLRKALEGRGMLCHVPSTLLAQTPLNKIENINDYCTGPLKEVLLQLSLDKLYEVVVKNIGPIALQFSQSLSKLNTTTL